jgi:hypothetical protein
VAAELELIEHIDKKFEQSRKERADTARELHSKIDGLAAENRLAHVAVTSRVLLVETKLGSHLIEHENGDKKTEGWVKLGAAGAFGGLATWIAKYFGPAGPN